MADETFRVADIQRAIDATGGGWHAEDNELTQLDPESRQYYLGYAPREDEPSLDEREQRSAANKRATAEGTDAVGAPSAFDLRNVGGKNYITDVRDQKNCGSCVAFGAVATVEGTLSFRRNQPNPTFNFSEAHLFYCIGAQTGASCGSGWWVGPALAGFRNPGVVDEGCFPYTPGDQQCRLCNGWQSRVYRIAGSATTSSAATMKSWLSTNGPLVACFTVYSDFFAYRSGVYRHVSGSREGGHCISVVGYDDAKRCWICKNSWGPRWGEGGFFRIGYGEVGIDAIMWSVDAS